MKKPVGIIGAGSFGVAVAKLLSQNTDVLMYSRKQEVVDAINKEHFHYNNPLDPLRIRATNSPKEICDNCQLIFPIVPSNNFRTMMKSFVP